MDGPAAGAYILAGTWCLPLHESTNDTCRAASWSWDYLRSDLNERSVSTACIVVYIREDVLQSSIARSDGPLSWHQSTNVLKRANKRPVAKFQRVTIPRHIACQHMKTRYGKWENLQDGRTRLLIEIIPRRLPRP
ncbi:uncharacterized protein CLUP02_05655 [Colletotrichum lupini]|uniref:Uncharacterized protein n=1 Tax=Colletotrichum lupini TaxID=145971 RepID=A0A9Q8SMX0_9PEZI|nr:uncharacterized protein CLUP02_05655 [Colletotrichum lupini]UQC80173.1 hypothetical protein CLUP02_05655 [Colletotrichum lupini]